MYQIGNKYIGIVDKNNPILYHLRLEEENEPKLIKKDSQIEQEILLNDCPYRVYLNVWKKNLEVGEG